jgi:glycosyltransferase involved in cell wall biosynthesis
MANPWVGLIWRLRRLIETHFYDRLVEQLAHQPSYPAPSANGKTGLSSRRIGYYTWHFPVLSQTFINRELAALKQSGVAFEIIADEPEEPKLADDNAKEVLSQAHYLEPIDANRLRGYHHRLFRSRPLEYLKSFCFVVSRRYGSYKTIYEDIAVFSRAVYLAGVALDRQIDHLHAPWSDRCAFVAMLAARLAGITYSVQARAHDIHRDGYLFALADKFEPAQFIVTNTRYNETHMKTFLRSAHWPKLFVIHNGVDLHRFVPTIKAHGRDSSPKLLCVARLIEQKGLIYLLQACAILRDQGYDFDCEIVGGTEDIFMNYYLDVKRLHRQLGLERQVRFTGSLPFSAVLEKYACADIFVLPCVIATDGSRDITPNALIEAMAMKLPVIATTVTGVPEIVEHGVSGILVPPKDVSALSEALMNLMRDAHLRKRLGTHARQRVEEKFDIQRNVVQYIKLFSGQNGAI